MRLNAALVRLGLADSRRAADSLIESGQVLVNAKQCRDFSTQIAINDTVTAKGVSRKLIHTTFTTILFNKPAGYVCSHRAQAGQHSIFELLPSQYAKFKLAGRLDIDSEGLLVLSDDGEMIQRLAHPSNQHEKTYIITVQEELTSKHLAQLRLAQTIDHQTVKAARVQQRAPRELEIVITTGLNRQVRRMAGMAGLSVLSLVRTKVGEFELGRLKTGQYHIVP